MMRWARKTQNRMKIKWNKTKRTIKLDSLTIKSNMISVITWFRYFFLFRSFCYSFCFSFIFDDENENIALWCSVWTLFSSPSSDSFLSISNQLFISYLNIINAYGHDAISEVISVEMSQSVWDVEFVYFSFIFFIIHSFDITL